MTGTPLLAIAVGAIPLLTLAVPLEGLAVLTYRCTLVLFVIINFVLIRIKIREKTPPLDVFVCARWVPYAGLVSCLLLLVLDFVAR